MSKDITVKVTNPTKMKATDPRQHDRFYEDWDVERYCGDDHHVVEILSKHNQGNTLTSINYVLDSKGMITIGDDMKVHFSGNPCSGDGIVTAHLPNHLNFDMYSLSSLVNLIPKESRLIALCDGGVSYETSGKNQEVLAITCHDYDKI